MQTLTGVVATGIAYYVYQKVKESSSSQACDRPPLCDYSEPIGLSGLYLSLQANNNNRFLDFVREYIDDTRKRFGRPLRTVAFRVLFFQDALFTLDPDNIRTILGLKFEDFELGISRVEGFRPYLGNGIFAATGKQWEHSRELLRPHFFRSKLEIGRGERHVQALITALERRMEPATGWTQLTDLQELFFRYTLDSTVDFLFGQSVDTQLGEKTDTYERDVNLSKAIHKTQSGISLGARLGPFYSWAHTADFKRAVNTVNEVIDGWILAAIEQRKAAEKEEAEQDKFGLLQALTKQTQDPLELRNQLLSLLTAGHDTTASTLAWFFVLMADGRNEVIFHRLRSAIIHDFGEYADRKEVTFGSIKSCQYLQWCINETLRLYPAVPLNIRVANKDTLLPTGGGADGLSPISLKKGEEVTFSVHLMHRCKEIWGQDAHVFRPERWEEKPSRWDYLPFNDGPRNCIGQQYAMVRIAHLLIRLLQRIDAMDGSHLEPARQQLTLVNLPASGVQVRVKFAE
ncbi:hypothetical protein XA68_16176 [Ophiocordyceps unilateralis]|uniref:Cytochrome P450 n=1 Tax=Ophiocordyceps unilateralis TaxID=268505 RepID=A0A2A9P5Q5_OPHUN|nr:hypothetical protein XA68_16176 [Ophiocordyceps unilateralis]